MASRNESQLRQRAEEYIRILADRGIDAHILSDSFRDYSVKVSVTRAGRLYGAVVIYFKEKTGVFTPHWNELKDRSIEPELQAAWSPQPTQQTTPQSASPGHTIYTDGSYQKDGDRVGYAAIVLCVGKVVHRLSGHVTDISQGQVLGEIEAIRQSLLWCTENNVRAVTLCFDFENLEKWATGVYKTNTPQTRQYAGFIRSCGVEITWQKVKGHSDDMWNNEVDKLAKRAVSETSPDLSNSTLSYQERDVEAELQKKVEQFVVFLNGHECHATLKGILNKNCAKIDIWRNGFSIGYLNVYHTSKKPFHLKCHELRASEDTRAEYQRLWDEFMGAIRSPQAIALTPERSVEMAMHEVEYYYTILKPFETYKFDFVSLAEATHRAALAAGINAPVVESLRYDFYALESFIAYLKQK